MHKEYDLIAIGGGSGGIATAVKAAQLGARCAIVESNLLGGTCVNVGCVPKKIMWLAGDMAHHLQAASGYGFTTAPYELNWGELVKRREQYIKKLHSNYQNKLDKFNIDKYAGYARFVSANTLAIGHQQIAGKHIVVATGGKPNPCTLKGGELAIDSDGFFALQERPKRVAIVGAGYIAVELAGICQALGCETILLFRHERFLRQFDQTVVEKLMQLYQQQGIALLGNHTPIEIERSLNHLSLHCENNNTIPALDCVIWAAGRHPNTQGLGLDALGDCLTPEGELKVDKNYQTPIRGIYGIGDVIGKMELTPVAIAQGRRLARRLFGEGAKAIRYEDIPTVIFSRPPLGTVGLSEADARQQYGDDMKVYQAQFTPMSQSLNPNPTFVVIKLITQASTDKIIGCHLLGDHADEILQGFAVAIHMGATKADFDDTLAIHPTIAEELVTLV